MLSAATSHETSDGKPPIDYKVATAEDLSFIASGSVDMVTAGQSAHWFKHEKSFPEIARILKPGGTLAFFCTSPKATILSKIDLQVSLHGTDLPLLGYGNFSIKGNKDLTSLLQKYVYGGPGTLGPYWEEPGRSIVVSLYRDIRPPESLYKDITRLYFPRKSVSGETEQIVGIAAKMTIRMFYAYGRTWSSYHGWQNAFPERKSRESGGEGDILDEMCDALKMETGWDDDTEFEVEWNSGVLLARKKEL